MESLPFEPTPDMVSANTLVRRIGEELLFCQRLYSRMGITPRAEARFFVRLFGLNGAVLALPDEQPGTWVRKSTAVDEEKCETDIVVGRVESDLLHYLKNLAEPLLEVFDFASLPDTEYEDITKQLLISPAV